MQSMKRKVKQAVGRIGRKKGKRVTQRQGGMGDGGVDVDGMHKAWGGSGFVKKTSQGCDGDGANSGGLGAGAGCWVLGDGADAGADAGVCAGT